MTNTAARLSPKSAIAWLRSRVISPSIAIENLSGISLLGEMLMLFEHYFPEDLKKYKRSLIFDEQDRMTLIRAFYTLVEKNLFPLDDWEFEIEEVGFSMMIPTASLNDDWWDFEFGHLVSLTQAILIGTGTFDEKRGRFDQFPLMNYPKLDQLVKGKGEPVCWLADAVRYVAHNTGYDWLDVTEEMKDYGSCSDRWDIKTVDAIAAVWLEVKVILDRFYAIRKWMDDCSKAEQSRRFSFVKKTVAACLVSGQEAEVEIPAGRPLVEVMDLYDEE